MWSHRRLMAAYADVIKTVTSSNPLPEVVPKSARQELVNTTSTALLAIPRAFNAAFNDFNELSRKPPRSYKHKPVTKALVESHVKGKLSELQAIYAQIEQSIPEATATKPVLSWLRETQKSLADFSSTLSMMLLVRRICAALWSLAIGLVAVGALWSAIFHVSRLRKGPRYIAVYALSVISDRLFGLALAGRRKRNLFLRPVQVLPPTWASDSQDTPTKSITAKNIYRQKTSFLSF